jgi:hypothetical protein
MQRVKSAALSVAKFMRVQFTSDPWLFGLSILSLLLIAVFGGYAVLLALQQGAVFNGYAADGPFQLYNPLRRLANGELIGRDFQFFHGIGVPLIHQPLFLLLGGNIFASEAARYLTTPIMFFISSSIFLYVILRSIKKLLVALAALLLLTVLYADVIFPSNSLIGIRTTFPILVAAAIAWSYKKQLRIRGWPLHIKSIVIALILALCFMFGTEQGVAAILAYVILGAVCVWRSKDRRCSIVRLTGELGLSAFFILLIFSIFTLGHPLRPIIYALINVPSDQFWYFGTPPNYYLNWSNFWYSFGMQYMWYVYAVVIVVIIALIADRRYFKRLSPDQAWSYGFLIVYGVMACSAMLGYFAPAQAIPLMRMALLIIVALMAQFLLQTPLHRVKAAVPRYILFLVFIVGGGLFLYNAYHYAKLARAFEVVALIKAIPQLRHSTDYQTSGIGWKASLDTFEPYLKQRSGEGIWSTYSSLYESSKGVFHPSSGKFDYIIHVLGDDIREQYVQDFERTKPRFAVTMRSSYFYYEEWIWSRNWQFYEHLLANYKVVAKNGSHFLWERKSAGVLGNRQYSDWQKVKAAKDGTFTLSGSEQDLELREVRVRYAAKSGLPGDVLTNLPRYMLRPSASTLVYDIALPPKTHEHIFVMPVAESLGSSKLKPIVDGLVPAASLDIQSVEYRTVSIDESNLQIFYDAACLQSNPAHKSLASSVCKPENSIQL